MRSRLVFGALDLHMLDHIGRGRKTREQADKACRHIEPHVDQERGAKAQSQHADQGKQFLAAPGDGIGGELPDESSPHGRFSLVSLCRSMSAVLRPGGQPRRHSSGQR
ncbi:MAG: hypothetical protein WA679_20665 [Pseudolabrys sp.]